MSGITILKIILLTNNDHDYPVLQSQLLGIYDNIGLNCKKILYCRVKGSLRVNEKEGYEVKYFNKTSIQIIDYIIYVLKLIKEINQLGEHDFVHVRGFVPGVVLFVAQFCSKKIKYIYDPRGAFILEKNEIGSVLKYVRPMLEYIERKNVENSFKTIVTSRRFLNLFSSIYGCKDKYIVNYNCSMFQNDVRKIRIDDLQRVNIVYVGTVNYWHDIEEIKNVLVRIKEDLSEKELYLYFMTAQKNHLLVKSKLSGLGFEGFEVKSLGYNEVGEALKYMHIGISVVRPSVTGKIASPIKVSDYIANGLIIVSNEGVGDFDDFYRENLSAVLYKYGNPNFFKEDLQNVTAEYNYRLLDSLRCCVVSKKISKLIEN